MFKKIGNKIVNIFLKFMAVTHIYFFFFPKYYYEDKSVQKRKIKANAIIIANHQKWIDPVLLIAMFLGRRLRFLTAKEVFKSKSRWFVKQVGCIPIDRKTVDMDGIKQAIEILRQGKVVVVFPEGKINEDSGIAQFRPGAILMAYKSGSPIVPVYIEKRYKLFCRKKVVVGKPLNINSLLKDGLTIKNLQTASDSLHDKLNELKELIRK